MTESYLGPYQISMMELFLRICIFDRVLKTSLDAGKAALFTKIA